MIKIINYSHPLSKQVLEELDARYGGIEEILVPCQIDFDRDILKQLD